MADGSILVSKPVTKIGRQEIRLGDCLKVMAGMEEESVDVVVTSPPYNLGLNYASYKDKQTEEEYLRWLLKVAAAVKRVLKPGGSFFLNLGGSSSQPWLPFQAIVRLRGLFELQNDIAWIKAFGSGVDSTGHFKPIQGQRFVHHAHEHIFHLTKAADVPLDRLAIGLPYKDKSNITRRGHERDLRCRGNTWFIPYSTVKSRSQKFNHPGTFPVELPLWCIYLHGLSDAVVLDPFLGTGTTLIAAERAGARGIGIEMDPAYVETACERLVQHQAEAMRLHLDEDELRELLQQDPETRGQGGYQNLLLNLQDRVNKTTRELVLLGSDVEQIKRYALKYNNGGWQKRIGAIFGRHLGVSAEHPCN